MCCGRGRTAYRVASARPQIQASAVAAQAAPASAAGAAPPVAVEAPMVEHAVAARTVPTQVGRRTEVVVRYLGSAGTRIVGPVTGRHYDVVPGPAPVAMEPRDAAVLLRQGHFART